MMCSVNVRRGILVGARAPLVQDPPDGGQPFHNGADAGMRPAQLVELLQVEPELCAGAKSVAEPDRGVGGDRTRTVDDPSDLVDRDADVVRQRRRAHANSLQLFRQVLARMNRHACHMLRPQ